MESRSLVAMALGVAGVTDLAIAFFVLAPRLPAERRTVVVAAMTASGLLLLALAVAAQLGVLPIS